jgi:hypothetical protein
MITNARTVNPTAAATHTPPNMLESSFLDCAMVGLFVVELLVIVKENDWLKTPPLVCTKNGAHQLVAIQSLVCA